MPLATDRRHPLYHEWAETTDLLWRSYLGGRAYHDPEADNLMLDKYPSELPVVFEARLRRAYLLNYMAATIDAYVSAVFRRDPVREPDAETSGDLSPGIQAFIEDATGDGSDLNQFSRDVATFALSCERAFVGVDIGVDNLPYAYRIHPANLLDFSQNPVDGSLNWAIVAEEAVTDEDPYSERVIEQRYRLWLPTEWILFDENGEDVESGPNSAGRVPIVAVHGENVRLPTYDIALINKRIYNHCSQLDEIFLHATFPTFYYSGGEGVDDLATGESVSELGDTSPLLLGPTRAIEVPSDKDMNVVVPGYLVPPDGPARLLMDERQRLADAIVSLAGLERKDPDALSPQSGVAKAYDFRETNERFVSLAQVIEEYEMELFDLLGAYGVAGEVNVSYNKEFQVKDFTLLVDNYLKLQTAMLPPVVKKFAAKDMSLAIAEEATEDEKREIREAVDAMTEFDPKPEVVNGNGAPTGPGQPGQPMRRSMQEILATAQTGATPTSSPTTSETPSWVRVATSG